MSAAYAWLFFRYVRWLLWLAPIGYSIEFIVHRSQHLDAFGNLSPVTEFLMFMVPLAAVFAGFFENMMRDKAGLPRPQPFQIGFKGATTKQEATRQGVSEDVASGQHVIARTRYKRAHAAPWQ